MKVKDGIILLMIISVFALVGPRAIKANNQRNAISIKSFRIDATPREVKQAYMYESLLNKYSPIMTSDKANKKFKYLHISVRPVQWEKFNPEGYAVKHQNQATETHMDDDRKTMVIIIFSDQENPDGSQFKNL